MDLGQAGVPTVYASPFDALAVQADDQARDRAGVMPLYARFQAVDVDPSTSGHWTTLPNGDGLWRVRLSSPGALALELFARDLDLPNGATLFIHDGTGEQVQGGYTSYNRQPDGSFSTDMVHGDALYVEYHEPHAVRGQGNFRITDIAHAYRYVGEGTLKASGPCNVDVNCSEGEGWAEQRDAVVRIRVVIPQGAGYCTGTLVNNTAQDCRPLILTALHCAEGATEANFNQFQFRFRYQRSNCEGGTVPTGNTMTGCVRRADSNDLVNGNITGSDFLLLELNNAIPASYQPYYAGWDATTTPSPNGRSIHHPDGDVKKVSTYANALANAAWSQTVGTHWRVLWTATTNGHGVTEPGSSGSPIFNPAKRIVGTLTGGGSCCTVNGCGSFTGPNVSDYYGKMSYHWTQNPNSALQKLKVWLDPMNFQTLVLDGSYDPCATIGMQDPMIHAPSLHPNPAADRVTIRYPEGFSRWAWLEVIDISGRIVRVDGATGAPEAVLDVAQWAPGAYVVVLVDDGVRSAGARFIVAKP